ncbi:glycoside hydrolase family 88 protein [Haloarcula pellucida]|uniref:Glucuronyl hydrolase n=1 Tax=Haloarcula pellucida TaxID=1427151 RepID=A0A830GIH9_9EURY|nr:glycoside hydrolase family 88 protein [Halomicroarcula pellucida]MBX0347435.1 glycoside hydrolase family 88 protein [Halomicroarcula pellucida]GGN88659.1 glucuronyl hydrolase [Halomicroarcula pellucida]
MTGESDQYRRGVEAVLARVETTLDATGDRFPYVYDREADGWETTADGNWCGGHWIGLLWLAAAHADDPTPAERFERAARDHTETMRAYMPRDSMFCGMNFLYAGFRGYDHSGDRSLFGLGLEGADAMVAAFHEGARQIPLGKLAIRGPEQFRGPESNHGPPGDRIGAVDNLYTAVSVLWRAYEVTKDPQFRDVAVSHADRHLDWYVREDGRTWHHAVFDETGTLERQYNELAHSDETCWARGQGWHVAGLATAYAATGAERYRRALADAVEYYRTHTPPDHVPHWDFEVPDPDGEPRDTSAAALVAYGLVTLLPDDPPVADLRAFGHAVLSSLVDSYLVTDPSDPRYGRVQHGCFNRPGDYAVDTELVWTQYYLASTLAQVAGDG